MTRQAIQTEADSPLVTLLSRRRSVDRRERSSRSNVSSAAPILDRDFSVSAFQRFSVSRVNACFAFTLLELLIVIAIMVALTALVLPTFTNLKSANDVTNAAKSIKDLLDNARTYAKANHTYVFFGFVEVDDSIDASVNPQVTTGNSPYGRVAVAAVASKDGTRHCQYSTTGQCSDWATNYNNGANFIPIAKLQVYENLHFVSLNFPSWAPSSHPSSKMARYQPSNNTYNLGTSNSVTPFTWPLGSPLTSGYKYRFDNVINFDPQGIARVGTSTNGDELTDLMEIDFQQTHGTVTPTPPTNQDVGNQFVIQIDAPTGALRLYRP